MSNYTAALGDGTDPGYSPATTSEPVGEPSSADPSRAAATALVRRVPGPLGLAPPVDARSVATRWLLGYSPSTAGNFARYLARYFTYCAQAGVDPLGVDTGFLAGYAEGLRAQAA
ncbi:MAG: hypothetical protein ACYCU5_16225, partial [Actinomycetes bacterium]